MWKTAEQYIVDSDHQSMMTYLHYMNNVRLLANQNGFMEKRAQIHQTKPQSPTRNLHTFLVILSASFRSWRR